MTIDANAATTLESSKPHASTATTQPAINDIASAAHALLEANLERSLPIATAHVLRRLQNDLLGVETIQRLIMVGHSPEAFERTLVNTVILQHQIESTLVKVIDDLALGHAFAQTTSQIKAAGVTTTTPSDDEHALNIMKKTIEAVRKDLPPAYKPSDETIDYDPLVDFVEYHREEGFLTDDPAWADGKRAKNYWHMRLSRSLKAAHHSFNAAVTAIDMTRASLNTSLLVTAMTSQDLLTIIEAAPPRPVLVAGPAPAKAIASSTPRLEGNADKLLAQGSSRRREILLRLLGRANELSSSSSNNGKGADIPRLVPRVPPTATATDPATLSDDDIQHRLRVTQEEALWHALLQAVEVRSDWALQWGASLVALGRYDEAIVALSISIETSQQRPSPHFVDSLERVQSLPSDGANSLTRQCQMLAQRLFNLEGGFDDDDDGSDGSSSSSSSSSSSKTDGEGEGSSPPSSDVVTSTTTPASTHTLELSKEERRTARQLAKKALSLRAQARVRLIERSHATNADSLDPVTSLSADVASMTVSMSSTSSTSSTSNSSSNSPNGSAKNQRMEELISRARLDIEAMGKFDPSRAQELLVVIDDIEAVVAGKSPGSKTKTPINNGGGGGEAGSESAGVTPEA